MPSFVSTKLTNWPESFFCPSPDAFVQQALKTIGIAGRTPGYWTHEIQSIIGYFLIPAFVINKLCMQAFRKKTDKEL